MRGGVFTHRSPWTCEVDMANRNNFLGGTAIDPKPVTGSMTVAELVDSAVLAYNAARLREACQLFVEKMLEDDVTIGMSLTGALTPAGLGMSAILPLIEYDVLLSTDEFYRKMIEGLEFQREMSTAEFHYLAGKYVAERERVLGIGRKSLLAAAHNAAVPVYTSSPGDSSIGMNV